jgi:tetratricopeptide (TPR) repeat protein
MLIESEKFSWFEVPDEIKELLILAAKNWENTSESEKYINQAIAKTEKNTNVLIAAYRFFFYKNNHLMALQTANQVIKIIQNSEQLPNDWQQLKPLLVQRKEEPNIRLYINAYAASGLVLAKLGEIGQAKEISARVKEIDDKNEFGAAILNDILTRPQEEE